MEKLVLLSKTYDGCSVADVGRDVHECLCEEVPSDEHGLALGTFRVEVVWEPPTVEVE